MNLVRCILRSLETICIAARRIRIVSFWKLEGKICIPIGSQRMLYFSFLNNITCSHLRKYYRQCVCVCMLSCSVISDSLQPHGMYPTRLLCPWDFSGKNTQVGSHSLLQCIFLTHPGIKPVCLVSPALAGSFFTTALPKKPYYKQ